MRDGLFSHRHNLAKPSSAIQYDSIDLRLRNRIWDFISSFMQVMIESPNWIDTPDSEYLLAVAIHVEFFGEPTDTLSDYPADWLEELREKYFESKWFHVYDLLEFVLLHVNSTDIDNDINRTLEREFSGYRCINHRIVPISSPAEIQSLNESIQSNALGVAQHISMAIQTLSNRDKPDYRAVVRESILAVESAARHVTGTPKATLGDALKRIKELHPALSRSYSNLYGWTSDAEGIRHALLDDKVTISADLAKYMLVSCSGFANYLISIEST